MAGPALAQERGLHRLFSSLERMFDPEPAWHLPAQHGVRRGTEPVIVGEPRRLSAKRLPERRRARPDLRSEHRGSPRAAQASLARPPERPRASATPGRPTAPTARDAAANPVAALLSDSTLRPGDIVMFPDGPKVFRGGGQAPHTLAAFKDARRSAAVSTATREALAALSRPESPRPQVAEGSTGGEAKPARVQTAQLAP